MREFKAKVEVTEGYEASIFEGGKWRIFGTPIGALGVEGFRSRRTAKAAAERMADAFNIKLKWDK